MAAGTPSRRVNRLEPVAALILTQRGAETRRNSTGNEAELNGE